MKRLKLHGFLLLLLMAVASMAEAQPYERADITSNTYWDWILNHVGSVYGNMDEVMKFAMTFKEYPSRSIPPSFSAYTIMEEVLNEVKQEQAKEKAAQKAAPAPKKKP